MAGKTTEDLPRMNADDTDLGWRLKGPQIIHWDAEYSVLSTLGIGFKSPLSLYVFWPGILAALTPPFIDEGPPMNVTPRRHFLATCAAAATAATLPRLGAAQGKEPL